MAVNTWSNITNVIKNKLKTGLTCPVYSGFNDDKSGNEFIKVVPQGSDTLEKATFLESREYEYIIEYYVAKRNNRTFEEHIYNRVAQVQDIFSGENIVLNLSDGTQFVNVTLETLEYNIDKDDEYEDYFVFSWDLTGIHYA